MYFLFIYTFKVQLPGISDQTTNNLGDYFNNIYRFSFLVGGILAIGLLVYYGIKYTISIGNGAMVDDAKDGIKQALYGLGLLASAYLILSTINPELVNLKEPGEGIGEVDFSKLKKPAELSEAEKTRQKFIEDSAKQVVDYQVKRSIEEAEKEGNARILELATTLQKINKEPKSDKNDKKITIINKLIGELSTKDDYIEYVNAFDSQLGSDENETENQILEYRRSQINVLDQEIQKLEEQLSNLGS